MTPDANDAFRLDVAGVPLRHQQRIAASLRRHESAREPVPTHDKRPLFRKNRLVDFLTSRTIMTIDFDNTDIRKILLDVPKNERIGIAHIRENDSDRIHLCLL